MKTRHKVLGLLFLLSMITYLDRVAISFAGKRMQQELNISESAWGWILGIFAFSYAVFEIPSGALGDRIGPRRVLTRIVVWWSVFTGLTGSCWNFVSLLVTRFMFGAGEAGAYPNASSSISRWFPLAERARAHGIVWMASRAGGALTPLLVIPLQQTVGWRATFYIFGAIGILWAVWWFAWYRDTPQQKPGVTSEEIQEIGYTAPKEHLSLPWNSVLKQGNFWLILLMYHTYCWGSYFYLSWLGNYLAKGRGFSEDEVKFYAMMPFIGGVFGNLTGGSLSDYLVKRKGLRFGRVAVGSTGLALSALCLLGTATTEDRILAVVFLSLGYFCMDCMLPVSWAICVDVGRRYAGAVTGSMNMAGQFGSFASSVLFGYLVDWLHSYNKPLIPMAGMLMISAVIYLGIDPTKQLVKETEPAPSPEPVHA